MTAPARTSFAHNDLGSGTSFTLATGLIPTGSWIVALVIIGSTAVTISQPSGSGWTTLQATQALGSGASRSAAVFGKVKAAGDASTTYTIGLSGTTGGRAIIMWGTGSDVIGSWVTGTVGTRTNGSGATSTTTVAPSITTTVADTLVLSLNAEASAGAEYASSGISGATEWLFYPTGPDNAAECLEVGYLTQSTPGATGAVTVTWPNGNSSNGWAVQIGIPPVGGSNYTGTASTAGTGTLTAGARLDRQGAAPTAGVGALNAAARLTRQGAASTTGTGALSADTTRTTHGDGTLTGAGTLTAEATVTSAHDADAQLDGTGTLTAAATRTTHATATLTGTGTSTATATRTTHAAGTLAGTGTLTADATIGHTITADAHLTGTAQLDADTTRTTPATAALAGVGVLTASAAVNIARADVTVTAELEPRRWAGSLAPRARAGSLPARRWKGSLT